MRSLKSYTNFVLAIAKNDSFNQTMTKIVFLSPEPYRHSKTFSHIAWKFVSWQQKLEKLNKTLSSDSIAVV